ncbi:chloride channel protein [Paraglaciecola aquimarina]|uniref:Chloride channel protein n=1 Tax=Paraglaciecola algarum TaxID=3050085 RepID=A0ABS9D4M7_9ALTE|nr:chloride channel protein [Paraglaciecola sp. G1-23]MCF2947614.1 chloride channel protein [Paraglaciecola sp. G1-23]
MKLDSFRQELATPRTSIQLCLMGIVSGICAALLIILFRLTIDWLQVLFVGEQNDFSDLSPLYRLILPIVGAGCILAVAYVTGFKHYRMGIPFVIHRVKHFFGRIPFRTTINQFFGGAIALASGFSVGREGPSVHLGASSSTFFGQWLQLPENSIRILSGCGIAAGISASFNTPFAAVIFVMEVVFREYKIHIFIPIMLAAACGSVLTRIVFGEAQELSFIHFNEFSRWIYLYLIILGIALGYLASVFNNSLMFVMQQFSKINMINRLLLAGVLTGIIGYILPESLGAHFDSAHQLFDQDFNLSLLFGVLCAKFLLTIIAIGLGIPGGVMGPVFVIGMLSGVLLASPLGMFINDTSELHASFSLLGMAGLMTAVVHAPLAALSAVMELSYSTELILPAILVVVPAYVTSTQFLGNSSIFTRQLDFQKLPYATSSVTESLQKTGVLAVMDNKFTLLEENDAQILSHLNPNSETLVVQKKLEQHNEQQAAQNILFHLISLDQGKNEDTARLIKTVMQGVKHQATLAEVYAILEKNRAGAVYIYSNDPENIIGVITWSTLRNSLHAAHY